jgi:hypothetical protein
MPEKIKFTDQPFFLLAVGAIVGVVGIFSITPVLGVCGLFFVIAFYKAGVVSGM